MKNGHTEELGDEGKKKKKKKDVNYKKLTKFWGDGFNIALAVGTCLLALEHDRFVTYLLAGSVEGYLGLGVLAASLFWLFDLKSATETELELFKEHHILERINPVRWQEYTTAVVVSLCFGGLIGAVVYPVIFCIMAVVIQVGDCIGVWMVQRAFFEVSQQTRGLSPALSAYYFYKPHSVHRVAKIVGFMTALVFAALAQSSRRSVFGILSWIVALATIVLGEGVLALWRRWLNTQLYEQRPNTSDISKLSSHR